MLKTINMNMIFKHVIAIEQLNYLLLDLDDVYISQVCFSHDGSKIVSGGFYGILRLFHV